MNSLKEIKLESRLPYKEKANEICRQVFENEYFNGLGIPLPEINFIEPDSNNFETGEYYIRIGETWQIHLNFGLLPKNILEFAEEVRVLTRHEIEHYKTCPFDVLTHLRMLDSIRKVYQENYSTLQLDLRKLASHLSNQISDVIIDTHNFRRYPSETLKSEIAWIKKGRTIPFNELPGHSKLMFLTKAALWQNDLELNEADEELLARVKDLAIFIDQEGITNPNNFLEKTAKYSSLFFELYKEEKQKENSNESDNSGQSSQNPSGEGFQLIPTKDSNQEGSSFIFSTPDNIKSAIEQFAQEVILEQFQEVLAMAGIKDITENEKKKIWFDAQNVGEISLPIIIPKGSNDSYSYPDIWKMGDPIEELDLMLTFSTSPKLLPGITTKKWSKNNIYNQSVEKSPTDLLLILDSSGSMGKLNDNKSNLFQAVLSSFGIINYFERINAEVSLINFSTVARVTHWTKDYNKIKEALLLDGQGNTIFPYKEMNELRKLKNNKVAIVIITDGEIQNPSIVLEQLREHLFAGNKLFMFLQDQKGTIDYFNELNNYGGVVNQANTADEIRALIISELL